MAQTLYLKDLFKKRFVHISQDHESTASHSGTGASDCIIDNGVITPVYAPCELELVSKNHNDYNTFLFRSTQKVHLTDNSEQYLILGFAHMEDENYYQGMQLWQNGDIFSKGSVIYYTGYKGLNTTSIGTRHVHIRLGTGNVVNANSPLVYDATIGRYVLNVTGNRGMSLDKAFYIDNMTITYSDSPGAASASHYNWQKVNAAAPEYNLTGMQLYARSLNFVVRSTPTGGSSSYLENVPVGDSAQILKFLGIYSDGYQWCLVNHNGTIGYSQIDTHNAYTVRGTPNKALYLKATVQSFRVRGGVISGTTLRIVYPPNTAQITQFLDSFQTDGYQWCRTLYDGDAGWSQIDTERCYTICEMDL